MSAVEDEIWEQSSSIGRTSDPGSGALGIIILKSRTIMREADTRVLEGAPEDGLGVVFGASNLIMYTPEHVGKKATRRSCY